MCERCDMVNETQAEILELVSLLHMDGRSDSDYERVAGALSTDVSAEELSSLSCDQVCKMIVIRLASISAWVSGTPAPLGIIVGSWAARILESEIMVTPLGSGLLDALMGMDDKPNQMN